MTLSLCVSPCQMVRTRTFGGTNAGRVKRSNGVADRSWGVRQNIWSHQSWQNVSELPWGLLCLSLNNCHSLSLNNCNEMQFGVTTDEWSSVAVLHLAVGVLFLREVQRTCHIAHPAMLDNAQQLSVRTIFRCRKVQQLLIKRGEKNLNERFSKKLALLGSKWVRTRWGVS